MSVLQLYGNETVFLSSLEKPPKFKFHFVVTEALALLVYCSE